MIVIHVRIQPQEAAEDFLNLLDEVVVEARSTPGCLTYEWYRVPDDPDRFVIYGEFGSEGEFHDYLDSPVVRRIQKEVVPALAGPPAYRHYRARLIDGTATTGTQGAEG